MIQTTTTPPTNEQLAPLNEQVSQFWAGKTMIQQADNSIPDRHLFKHSYPVPGGLVRAYTVQNWFHWCFVTATHETKPTGFSTWCQDVNMWVKQMLGANDTDATGLENYGQPDVARQHGMEPHPVGNLLTGFAYQTDPFEYARPIAIQLRKIGWCY